VDFSVVLLVCVVVTGVISLGYRLIERARAAGDTVMFGGAREWQDKLWYQPTLIAPASNTAEVVQREIFGPVLTWQTFADEADAIALANSTDYGLAGVFYTADAARAERVGRASAPARCGATAFSARLNRAVRRLRHQRHRPRRRRLRAGLPQRFKNAADFGGGRWGDGACT